MENTKYYDTLPLDELIGAKQPYIKTHQEMFKRNFLVSEQKPRAQNFALFVKNFYHYWIDPEYIEDTEDKSHIPLGDDYMQKGDFRLRLYTPLEIISDGLELFEVFDDPVFDFPDFLNRVHSFGMVKDYQEWQLRAFTDLYIARINSQIGFTVISDGQEIYSNMTKPSGFSKRNYDFIPKAGKVVPML